MGEAEYDAIIIGGGHNGLVTAGYLAKDGLSVLVLERQDVIGGACVSEELYPGFIVPYCAYICYLLQGRVIDDLELRDFGLEIIPIRHGNFHPFPDGRYLYFEGREDHQAHAKEIAKLSQHDADAYPEWSSFWDKASDILHRYWLKDPPTLAQVFGDVRGTAYEEVWQAMLTTSVTDLLDQYFESDYVKAHFVEAMDSGDPGAPGSLLSAAYYGCSRFSKPENVGIPRGSMGSITQAMARSAEARGVEIRTGVSVEEVMVEKGIATGVRLSNGDQISGDVVVSNADPKRTYLGLIDAAHLDEAFLRRVKNLTTRANCVKFLAALSELPDFSGYLGKGHDPRALASVRICPSVDYYQQSWDDARRGRVTTCPLMDIQIPSIYDPALAPPGHHVLSNWVLYYPSELEGESWDNAGKRIGEQIIDILSEYAPNFRRSLIDWTVQTPKDIETREGMTDGNIRHIDVTPSQIFARRMPYRSPIKGLYLCGSGTHPGGEVTGAPGHNAARAILADWRKIAEGRP
ncbi:MAG: NAD(P)/FAD-dependent oxidoreductase, partial [Chloroflexi bacterium]|nr:NAD(P)/FAD-dependent oxidoreductase [Chloroflexota bacterium]